MQFEGRRRSSYIPNLTPLIDIVFLLLIFFMLTSHFVKDEVINMDLPEAETGESSENFKQLEVIISDQNTLIFNKQTVNIAQLEEMLNQALTNQEEKVVRIRGDKEVDLGIAIDVFDAAKKAGAQGIDIVTIEEKPAL